MNVQTFLVMKDYDPDTKYEPPQNAPTDFWLEVLVIAGLATRVRPEPMTGRNEWSHLFVHVDDDYDEIVKMGMDPEAVYWVMQEFGYNDNSEDFKPVADHEYLIQGSGENGRITDTFEVLDLSDTGNPGRIVWAGTYQECEDWIDQEDELDEDELDEEE